MRRTRHRLTRAESQERTREDLLDAAAEVFARRGFNAASVEEVAEAAGYSKGAVYSNFAGKADLFLALLDREIHRVEPEWEEVFAADKTVEERVAGVATMLGGTDCGQTMMHMEFLLHALREPEARGKLAERYREMRAGIAENLERHFQAMGGDPPIPLDQLAWVMEAIELGLRIQACVDPDAVPEGLWAASQFPIAGGAGGTDARQSDRDVRGRGDQSSPPGAPST